MATIMSNPFTMDQQDDMEITDNAQSDLDFDIEFDNAPGDQNLMNEDEMQDDVPAIVEPEDIELRSATAEADYMIDDIGHDAPDDPDGVMVDDAPLEEVDEELLDFSDEEIGYVPAEDGQPEQAGIHTAHDQTAPPEDEVLSVPSLLMAESEHNSEPVLATSAGGDQLSTASETANQTVDQEGHAAEVVEPVTIPTGGSEKTDVPNTSIGKTSPPPDETEGAAVEDSTVEGDAYGDQHSQGRYDIDSHALAERDEVSAATAFSVHEDEAEIAVTSEQNEANEKEELGSAGVSESVNIGQQDEAEHVETKGQPSPRSHSSDGQHTYTGLHTTIVKYDGGEYTLFPSSGLVEGEEYFLENENLASGSIGDLLHACRITLGEAISEDEELELHVEEFGLYLSEDSPAAFSTSFSEILDIFVQLHRQDGNEQPPAMSVSLTRKPRFANRLTLLANAAAEGKGFSQLTFLSAHMNDSPTYAEEYQDEEAEDNAGEVEAQPQLTDHQHTEPDVIERLASGQNEPASTNGDDTTSQAPGDAHTVGTEQLDDTATSRTLSPHYGQELAAGNADLDDGYEHHEDEQKLFEDDFDTGEPELGLQDQPTDPSVTTAIGPVSPNRDEYKDDDAQLLVPSQPAAEGQAGTFGPDHHAVHEIESAKSAEDITDAPNDFKFANEGNAFDDDDFLDLSEDDSKPSEAASSNKRNIEEVVGAEEQDSKRPRSS
ncbi:hypothetical protein BDZ85DRAFT_128485 [Elsinoe ampelina]|uniref:Uncharacterized protein n=1 Tax=Elsinoe ampelina TaxID=302913 RepID=A0A6A6G9Q2_9PEZI|nr:hypothetical protein BDZ85DRAFT_128485 [Elsinoe ampelina]